MTLRFNINPCMNKPNVYRVTVYYNKTSSEMITGDILKLAKNFTESYRTLLATVKAEYSPKHVLSNFEAETDTLIALMKTLAINHRFVLFNDLIFDEISGGILQLRNNQPRIVVCPSEIYLYENDLSIPKLACTADTLQDALKKLA